MKTFKYLALVLAILVSSCVNLKETPESFITADNFYKTQSDAVAAVTAVYFLLNSGGTLVQTPYNTLFSTGMDMMSDDVDPGPGATNPDVRSQAVLGHSSSGLRVLQIWQQHYSGIVKANVAISKIATIPSSVFSSATIQNRLIAEAKFLRALYYFNLVRLYGDVPLVLESSINLDVNSLLVTRTPTTDVYAQIIKDLTEATAILPPGYSGSDVGRATSGAALSILAKVYLTLGSLPSDESTPLSKGGKQGNNQNYWQLAASTANTVITGSYGYNLISNYGQVFLPAYKNGVEHIFSAQFQSNSLQQGNNQAPRGQMKGPTGVGVNGAYSDQVRYYKQGNDNFFSIYKLYSLNDKRRHADASGGGTFQTRFKGSDGKFYSVLNVPVNTVNGVVIPGDSVPFLNKYWDPAQSTNESQSAANVPIIRFAEVLLIHAEAENEANGGPTAAAYASINKVRTRAGLPNLTSGLSQAEFRDSVYLDRRLELVWENQRWFDLIRQQDANGNGVLLRNLHLVGKTNAALKHYLYPIPQQEIQLNPKLTQNPGY